MNGMPEKGYLHNYRLADMLNYLNRNRITGTLTVTSYGLQKSVHMQKGSAVFATSTYEDDRLGEVLVKAGLISVRQFDEATALLKRTGKRLGTVLVETGALTPQDLFWGVKFQVMEIIFSLFQLRDGLYEFREGEIPSEVITLDISMASVIYEGVKRVNDFTRIKGEMPDMDSLLVFTDDPRNLFQDVELSEHDREVLALLDGNRSIRDMLDTSRLNSFDTLKVLYTLWSIGLLTDQFNLQRTGLTMDEVLSPVKERKEDFLSRVKSTHAVLESLRPHKLLGVDEGADFEVINRQYYKLSKEFHPDRFFGTLDEDNRDRVADIFDAISFAFKELKKRQIRRQFTEGDSALALELLKQAKEEIKKGNHREAANYLEEAVKSDPDNAECWSHLSLAMSKLPGKQDEAVTALKNAQGLNPGNAAYFANLGLLYLKLKRLDDAKHQFEEALHIDPRNEKAQKGLSLLLTGGL